MSRVSNSLDLGETSSYSASHPDPISLHIMLSSKVVLGGLRVKITFECLCMVNVDVHCIFFLFLSSD